MNEILVALGGIIMAGGSGYFGWYFGRRRTKAEAVSVEIDNDIKLSKHYTVLLDDLKTRYEQRFNEYEAMQQRRFAEYDDMMQRKVTLLEEELKLKDRKIKLQQQEINQLRRENKVLKDASNGN